MKTIETILLADDDPALSQVLVMTLESQGYVVVRAADGIECLQMAYEHHPDLILLDILMPRKDGREVCRQLRTMSPVPIIFISALGTGQNKTDGLNDGADDYVAKPFTQEELIARVQAVLRRSQPFVATPPRIYDDGYLFADFDTEILRVNGTLVDLTHKQWRLLEFLHRHRGQMQSRQTILRHVWGGNYTGAFNYLKVYISKLRAKIGDSVTEPQYIITERAKGYWFEGKKKK
jgi:DNA-binding response OmpR family regulator